MKKTDTESESSMEVSKVDFMSMPWMSWMEKHDGEKEIPGSHDNPFITDCFKFTSYRGNHDEVPWCAALACRALEENGFKSPHNAGAWSFKGFGEACEVQPGAFVVFKWANGSRHITFIDHVVDKTHVACRGGNQSNALKVSTFERKYIEYVGWPTEKLSGGKAPTPTAPTEILRLGSSGPQVEYVQEKLAAFAESLSPGSIDGDFGPKTLASLHKFQLFYNLPVTDMVDSATKAKLG